MRRQHYKKSGDKARKMKGNSKKPVHRNRVIHRVDQGQYISNNFLNSNDIDGDFFSSSEEATIKNRQMIRPKIFDILTGDAITILKNSYPTNRDRHLTQINEELNEQFNLATSEQKGWVKLELFITPSDQLQFNLTLFGGDEDDTSEDNLQIIFEELEDPLNLHYKEQFFKNYAELPSLDIFKDEMDQNIEKSVASIVNDLDPSMYEQMKTDEGEPIPNAYGPAPMVMLAYETGQAPTYAAELEKLIDPGAKKEGISPPKTMAITTYQAIVRYVDMRNEELRDWTDMHNEVYFRGWYMNNLDYTPLAEAFNAEYNKQIDGLYEQLVEDTPNGINLPEDDQVTEDGIIDSFIDITGVTPVFKYHTDEYGKNLGLFDEETGKLITLGTIDAFINEIIAHGVMGGLPKMDMDGQYLRRQTPSPVSKKTARRIFDEKSELTNKERRTAQRIFEEPTGIDLLSELDKALEKLNVVEAKPKIREKAKEKPRRERSAFENISTEKSAFEELESIDDILDDWEIPVREKKSRESVKEREKI